MDEEASDKSAEFELGIPFNEAGEALVLHLAAEEAGGPSRLARLGAFTAVKTAAKAEFYGGVIGGLYATHILDVNPYVVPVTLAALITITERAQTRWALNRVADVNAQPAHQASKLKDLAALGMASYQGAGPNLAYNDAVGLANTPWRLRLQGASYAVAIGLWTSPIPPWKYGGDGMAKAAQFAIENPFRSTGFLLGSSALTFGILEGVKEVRKRRRARNDNI